MLRSLNRLLVRLAITLLVFVVLEALLSGFSIESSIAAILGILAIGALNAVVRPVLVRLTLPLNLLTFGLLSLILNGLLILAVRLIVPGFYVADIWNGILISLGMMVSQTLVSNSTLYDEADRAREEYLAIRRLVEPPDEASVVQTPGLLLLEIDGLAEPLLRKAIEAGYMPTLAAWLKSGSHKLVKWETSLPSQTSSMQAGILHGSHHNIPGFRFYEKANRRLMVSNRPWDAVDMLAGITNGQGTLRQHGFSLNNWASGDAPESALTFSTIKTSTEEAVKQSNELYSFFANTYSVPRVFMWMIVDIFRELREARYQRTHNVLPRIERKFPYPLVRAVTTVLLPELSAYLIVTKMLEGISLAYTTFINYDEVAHHSGTDRPDALRILRQLDRRIKWIANAVDYAPRPYEFVILSDHGQSMGATFQQRYGKTLSELVSSLLDAEGKVTRGGRQPDEGVFFINLLLSQLIGGDSRRGRTLRRALQGRTTDGYVDVDGREHDDEHREATTVVCPSGNLGLIYFTGWSERISLETINHEFPGLVDQLVKHEGIGFVMAHSETAGPVVIGKTGKIALDKGQVEGENPLASFGEHAAQHLKELDGYSNVGDLVVNSCYDPQTGEVAAFENLVGSHGGLGGSQNEPFILYPAKLEPAGGMPTIVGAPAVYKVILDWLKKLEQQP
jgi:putative membrane protein